MTCFFILIVSGLGAHFLVSLRLASRRFGRHYRVNSPDAFSWSVVRSVIAGLVIGRPIGAALTCGFFARAVSCAVSFGGADLFQIGVLRGVRTMDFVLFMCCVDIGACLGALVFRCVLGAGYFGVGGFSSMYFVGSGARGFLSCIRGRIGLS